MTKVFVQADYATIELRVICVEAQDPFLAEIFRAGRDIHDEFSLQFYGPDFTKDQRVRTKAFVYGLAYGREPFSVAQEFKIPVREAEAQQKAFFDLMPGVVQWRAQIEHAILNEGEDLVTHFGRRRRFWLITDTNRKDVIKEGLAFIPQSTANDICLHAGVRLRREYDLPIRIPVHDSLLAEVEESEAQDVGRVMKEVMEKTALDIYSTFVPFPVDVEIGTSWGDLTKEKYDLPDFAVPDMPDELTEEEMAR